jgi:hypothetical protein
VEALFVAAEAGDAGKEGFGVSVLGIAEDALGVAVFDNFAAVHDGDAFAKAANDGEVVGDEDEGHAKFGAEAFEFGEDLGLDRHI